MLAKLVFLFMIELTTGVVFLMSSMYGSGTADNHVSAIALANNDSSAIASTTETSSSSNSNSSATSSDARSLEALLRKEFVNEPILVDIARCESNYHQFDANGNVVHGRVDKADIGVMQINERYQGDSAKKLGFDLYTVEGNIAYAKHLYQEQGTKPWSASQPCWGGDLARK
jgi:hypothetical protein